jgi:hypothetical protein
MSQQQGPGWYWQDGLQPGQKRYWDGQQWTDRVTVPRGPMGPMEIALGVVVGLAIVAAVLFALLNQADILGNSG